MDYKELYALLGKDDTIYKIALVTGFTQIIACGGLQAPLSTLCCAIIFGLIYYLLVTVVLYICPDVLKPFVSLVLIASMLYYLFSKKACEPVFKMDIDQEFNRNRQPNNL